MKEKMESGSRLILIEGTMVLSEDGVAAFPHKSKFSKQNIGVNTESP